MEFRELLKRRRMVRAYMPEPVSRAVLERIVATIRRAPSAGFSQGQRLVVVTENRGKQAMAEAVGEDFYLEQGFAPWMSGAAALVVVCTREEDYRERYRQPDKIRAARDDVGWPVPNGMSMPARRRCSSNSPRSTKALPRACSAFPSSGCNKCANCSSCPTTSQSSS